MYDLSHQATPELYFVGAEARVVVSGLGPVVISRVEQIGGELLAAYFAATVSDSGHECHDGPRRPSWSEQSRLRTH